LQKQFDTLKKHQSEYSEKLSHKPEIEQLEQKLKQSLSANKIGHIQESLQVLIQQQQQFEHDISNLKSGITNKQACVTTATHELTKAQQAVTASSSMSAEIFRLQQLQPNVANLRNTTDQYQLLLEKYTSGTQQLQKEQSKLAGHKQALEETERTLKEWEAIRSQLPTLIAENEKQNTHIQRYTQRLALGKQIDSNHKIIAQHESRLSQLKTQGLQQKEHLNATEYRWHTQQAAVLAATLSSNQPCPVCGSLEHPTRAQHDSGDIISTDTINAQREQLEALRTDYAQQQHALAEQQAQQQQAIKEKTTLDAQIGTTEYSLEQEQHRYNIQLEDIQRMKHQISDIPRLLQQVELLQQKIAKTEVHYNTSQEQCQRLNTELARATEKKELLEQAIPKELRDNDTLQQRIHQHQKALEDTKNYETLCQKSLEQAQLNLNTQATTLQQQENSYQSLKQSAEQEASRWHNALTQNGFTNEENFTQAKCSEEQQQSLKNHIDGFTQKIRQLETLIHNQETLLEGQPIPNIERLSEDFEASEQRYQTQQIEWQQHQSKLENLLHADKKLKSISKQLQSADKEFELLGTLAQTANGKNPQKISLQRFVLGVLLDDVLIEASQRLIKMSKGRYRLLRNNDRAKGNRASGLELLIEDNYTGITRSAATLSGGESFLAALALALGLSDVVQAYAGGIQLDALFIDEGFGSLDQEALDLAIDTLMELQSSGKMIGIISHVTELKAQMALQVEIISSPNGSTLRLKLP
jgi:exonuclease SbcC